MNIKHVLLIDDNEVDNYILKHALSKSKMAEKISVKNSAVEALEYLIMLKSNSEEFPELIFLDISMPIMDGFGFLEEFSKFPDTICKQCAVVMLTSSINKDDVSRAFQFPVVKKYLNKPMNPDILDEIIKLANK